MAETDKPMGSFTLQQVAEHNTLNSVWMAIHGDVYDVTKYLDEHPGGREVLKEVAGTDATEDFDYVGHSDDARQKLEALRVGTLDSWVKKPDAMLLEKTPNVTQDQDQPRAPAFKPSPLVNVAAVSGIALLYYCWGFSEDIIPETGHLSWLSVGVVLGIVLILWGSAGLSIRNILFNHGKGAFQYPPYYIHPLRSP